MQILRYTILLVVSFAVPALATVTVSSPANGATVTSPVQYTATATTSTCSTGVSSMGIYVNNNLAYFAKGAQQINTSLSLGAGAQHTVVVEWDHCGGSSATTVNITVGSSSSSSGGQTNGVVVTSPANNSTVTSPVHYVASASTNTCAAGVSSMGIYVDNKLAYFAKGAQQINTYLSLSAGAHHTVVEEWDHCGGASSTPVNITVGQASAPTLTLTANPSSITAGSSSTLTATATNATQVVITGTDGSRYTLPGSGGNQSVSPTATTTYTGQASGSLGSTMASTTVTVIPAGSDNAIQHVIFMLQENRSFDSYFGMLNPYRESHSWTTSEDGKTYSVDGIDHKLTTISNKDDEGTVEKLYKFTTTCIDDDSSAWEESYGDVNRYDFLATRPILMDGFVHIAEGFAKSCAKGGSGCSGQFTDLTGERAMGYYDQTFLNYYYYMASQFAVSDRWFSPVSSYSISNRIATFDGGTTQGLVRDPQNADHLSTLNIETIFQELDQANVSWKIYYTVTNGHCLSEQNCTGSRYPATDFSNFAYSSKYLHGNPTGTCAAPRTAARGGA